YPAHLDRHLETLELLEDHRADLAILRRLLTCLHRELGAFDPHLFTPKVHHDLVHLGQVSQEATPFTEVRDALDRLQRRLHEQHPLLSPAPPPLSSDHAPVTVLAPESHAADSAGPHAGPHTDTSPAPGQPGSPYVLHISPDRSWIIQINHQLDLPHPEKVVL